MSIWRGIGDVKHTLFSNIYLLQMSIKNLPESTDTVIPVAFTLGKIELTLSGKAGRSV